MKLSLKGEAHAVDFVLTPEMIEITAAARTMTLDSLTDAVELPTGKNGAPLRYSWSGILVGRARTRRGSEHLNRERWTDPERLDERLREWANGGRKLRLVATDSRIRGPVFIQAYRSSIGGGHGDINYSLELVEWRELKVHRKGSDKKGKGKERDGSGGDKKKGANKSEGKGGDRKTYTVKGGDTLGAIAKKFLGSVTRWREIYEIDRNRKTIGPNPDALQPGMILVIPEK